MITRVCHEREQELPETETVTADYWSVWSGTVLSRESPPSGPVR